MDSDAGLEFSKHFDRLKLVGGWRIESQNTIRTTLYKIFQIVCILFLLLAMTLQSVGFWMVIGDVEKMAYNMSFLVLTAMGIVKILISVFKSDILSEFRLNLWNDYSKFDDKEIKIIKKAAVKQLKLLSITYYGGGFVTFTIILSLAYFNGKRGPIELPFPAFVPISQNDVLLYTVAFSIQAIIASVIIVGVIETDLIVVGFLLQLIVQYKILSRKILKINEIYDVDDTNDRGNEINKFLITRKIEEILKEILHHQTELRKYARILEHAYDLSFGVQIVGCMLLIIMNGFQVFQQKKSRFNSKIMYQALTLLITITDLFYNCFFPTILRTECEDVGSAAYSIAWYKMDGKLRKYFLMIILQAQRPPKITAGKLILLELNKFLGLIKTSYSWLTVFREIASH